MRVVQITDTHITADPADQTVLEMLGDIELIDSARTLAHIVADIGALEVPPDLVVATGDLGDRGHPASYRRLRALLAPLRAPIAVLPGNHDLADAFDEHLPGGAIEAPDFAEHGNWAFVFARTGNTEWGEIGAAQLERLSARCDARRAEHVFLFLHHPPINLHGPFSPSAPFLADDVAELARRHRLAGMAAGHVHSVHDREVGGVALHATPSTYMGAPAPGYRIFDFGADGYTTETRTFPELRDMTDAKRDRLVARLKPRIEAQRAHTPTRGDEHHARAEVLAWQREADERRGRAPADA